MIDLMLSSSPVISLLLLHCISICSNNFIDYAVASNNSNLSTIHERIITDIEDVLSGVPVDFSYNESVINGVLLGSGMTSAPGCPKSVIGYPWVYYGSPTKCFLAGEKGPCDPDQKLFVEYGSSYGFCNSECFEGAKRSMNTDTTEFCTSLDGREYVFIPGMKKCFSLYDQGPCRNNEWLVKKSEKTNRNLTQCERRKCPQGQLPYFVNQESSPSSSANFTCFSPISPYFSPVSIIPNDCEAGMKFSKLLKKCVKKFAFDLGRK